MNIKDGTKLILTETHMHTSEVSMCARVPAAKIPQLYKDAGYGKLIVTDHYNKWTLDQFVKPGWKDPYSIENKRKMNAEWLKSYEIILSTGKAMGIDVFLGMEICLGPEDFLIYGMTREFLEEYPALYELNQEALYKLLDSNGMLLYQAHPFRPYLKPQNPNFMHGAEVFNGNSGHDNNNDKALRFAEQHNLLKIAGSDFHHYDNVGLGGIYLPEDIKTNNELVNYLRCNEVTLFRKSQ